MPARKAKLAGFVEGWHEPIEAAVAATPEDAISGTGICWRKPARSWVRGRVTLLGDPVAGLRAYEEARRKRTAQIVRRSYQTGRLAQSSSAACAWLRDALMGSLPDRLHGIQQAKIVETELPVL